MHKHEEEYENYMKLVSEFKLGSLTTESSHPHTSNLSQLAVHDLPEAIRVLKDVDLVALEKLTSSVEAIGCLAEAIRSTLDEGHRIYLCGCGATGRLSLSLEVFCREGLIHDHEADRVIAFMAGGDAALIRSIENFEDYPEFGARQLTELGFQNGDLLISTTEGGETSFVIGATEEAARNSDNKPWFLYCNPDDELIAVERSKRVINNNEIHKINLTVGPMGIAGSTRMQASTVLMTAVGLAFMCNQRPEEIEDKLRDLIKWVSEVDFGFLNQFIQAEHKAYKNRDYILYRTDHYGITVLTDTTERSPTFSLPPFENYNSDTDVPCLCYLMIEGSGSAEEAWHQLLKREPRCLDWDEFLDFAGVENFYGYKISSEVAELRKSCCEKNASIYFDILRKGDYLHFQLGKHTYSILLNNRPLFFQHVLLKLIINIHSTLLMGRMGRYEGNLMTYVKPSNYKLIDRSIRYIQILYNRKTGETLDYARAARQLFEDKVDHPLDEPIVLKVLESLLHQRTDV